MSSKKDERVRNWTFIIYPESAPNNWRDILDEEHFQWIESPLHDKDENADGNIKKPHYHVLLLFPGKKSFEQIKELTDKLNAPIPQKVNNAKGLVRYMAHLDNPEKVQYKTNEIIGHGGADVAEYLKISNSSRYLLIGEMMNYIRDNGIIELKDLLYYAQTERFDDWFPLLCDNSAYIIGEFIKSCRHSRERETQQTLSKPLKCNPDTGEVLE